MFFEEDAVGVAGDGETLDPCCFDASAMMVGDGLRQGAGGRLGR